MKKILIFITAFIMACVFHVAHAKNMNVDILQIGKIGSSVDAEFRVLDGATVPFLKYDKAANEWLFSNDGILETGFDSAGTEIVSGTSTVEIPAPNGAVEVNTAGFLNATFGATGILTLYDGTDTNGAALDLHDDNEVSSLRIKIDSNDIPSIQSLVSGEGMAFTATAGHFGFNNGTTTWNMMTDGQFELWGPSGANGGSLSISNNGSTVTDAEIYKAATSNDLVIENKTSGSDIYFKNTGAAGNLLVTTTAGTGNLPFGCGRDVSVTNTATTVAAGCSANKFLLAGGCSSSVTIVATTHNFGDWKCTFSSAHVSNTAVSVCCYQ